MSLINEALNKAQQDRPQMSPAPPPGGPMPPPRPPTTHETKKHRGFLWGFLLAVMIVGGVSSLLAAFLVLQLLDPKSPAPPDPPIVQAEPSSTQFVEEPVVKLKPVRVEDRPAETRKIPIPETVKPEPIAATAPVPITENPPVPKTVPVPNPTVAANPPPDPNPVATAINNPSEKALTASLPNPEVITRLQEIEIRGIMSGATKVLLHDLSTGKTKAYKEGESLMDSFGLNIYSISPSSIKFKDYAGHIHTKSF